MFKTGLVSITFRQKTPEEIARLVKEAGLQAIEWGGDVHVPHGNTEAACAAAEVTRAHGLEVASYGSYYRLGAGDSVNTVDLPDIVETARALGAPQIRVWAGNVASADADEGCYQAVAADAHRAADLAAPHNIRIAYEYHGNTLTDSIESAVKLLSMTRHPNIDTNWQPINGADEPTNLRSVESVLPRLGNLHVFHWTKKPGGGMERHPLAEGRERWLAYLRRVQAAGGDRTCLLEFVEGDTVEQFQQDATTLRELVAEANNA